MFLLISLLSRVEAILIPWLIALLIVLLGIWIIIFYIILGGEPGEPKD